MDQTAIFVQFLLQAEESESRTSPQVYTVVSLARVNNDKNRENCQVWSASVL
jgi:hypothetical protein